MIKNIYIQLNSDDHSTDDVISWLFYLAPKKKVLCYFDHYTISSLTIEINNQKLDVKIDDSTLDKNSIFWYRRGSFTYKNLNQSKNIVEEKIFYDNIPTILELINSSIYNSETNKYEDNSINKLKLLNYCTSLNINIPDTLITDKLLDVKKFLKKHNKLISKPLRNPFGSLKLSKHTLTVDEPTKLITTNNINRYPLKFSSFFVSTIYT